MDELIKTIQSYLTEDLLKPQYRNTGIPFFGHCYVACEAIYHLTGCTLKPVRAKDDTGIVHWWLVDGFGNIIDPTKEQYEFVGIKPPYEKGRGGGFLTKNPSKRAQKVIDLVLGDKI